MGKPFSSRAPISTQVNVLDTADGKPLQTINFALYPQAPSGNTPNSLTLTPDGPILFVANADANNLAVFNVSNRKQALPLGFIPTGWYPTSVAITPVEAHRRRQRQRHVLETKPAGPSPQRRPASPT